MRNTRFIAFGLVAGISLLQGCAHTAEKVLDDKLANEKDLANRAALRAESRQAIETTPGLSADQRGKLDSIRQMLSHELDKLREESWKLRGILVKDMISPAYDEDEVALIKERLRTVEKQKLSAIFKSLDKVNEIMGRPTFDHARIMHDLFDMGRAF